MKQSAVNSDWLKPIYVEDFEESGDEFAAIHRLQASIRARLKGIDIQTIARSQDRRLASIRQQLKDEVGHVLIKEVLLLRMPFWI